MARAFIQRAKESPSTVISEFVEGMTSGKGNLLPPDLTFKDLLRAEHGDLDAQKKVKEAFDAMDDTGFCFLAGTPITLADNSTHPIEQIQLGDQVLSYDELGNLTTSTVTRTRTIEGIWKFIDVK